MLAMLAQPAQKAKILPLAPERRRHQRVKVNLLGRYMLEDRLDMSPGGMALAAPVVGGPGERVRLHRSSWPAEDRRHGRFVPKNVPAHLILPNGDNVGCRVIDLSASGAAISIGSDLRPLVGVLVTVGKTQGRLVRHIDNGFAIEFTRLQHPDFVEENVTGQ
jgi:hypothetical protein